MKCSAATHLPLHISVPLPVRGITWWSAKAGPPSLTFTHRCQSLTKGLCRFVCEEHRLPMITAFEGQAAANAPSQKKGPKKAKGDERQKRKNKRVPVGRDARR